MDIFRLTMGIVLILFISTVSATTVNGRFVVTKTDSAKLTVLLQINTNTGTDAMGGATIVIGFDTTGISFIDNPVKDTDYIFHNFCSGNYSTATITRPIQDRIWVNIDLPFNNSNSGTVVADTSGWTDVVTIYFNILDPEGSANLYWLSTSPFWGVYADDNLTLWDIGEFEDQISFPLSVELNSFTASLLDNNNVLLRWSTTSSVNSYGFEIEKSQKSEVKSQNEWEVVGFVESLGNSNTLMEYSFTDVTTHYSPVIKYRLKLIDNDGSFDYSDVVEVYTGPIEFELLQNYPNPFNPSTKISYTIPNTVILSGAKNLPDVQLKIYDILGNEIITLVDDQKAPGQYEVTFDADGLASGIYLYRLIAGDFIETKKMVLLR